MRARRVLAVTLTSILAFVLMATTVLAGVTSATDSFPSPSYSGGQGWNGNWLESGDGGGAAGSGAIQAVSSGCDGSSCVRFTALLGVAGTYSISRTTDIGGADSATLTFTYQRNGLGTLSVATRSGPSDGWTQQTLSQGTGAYSTHSLDITADAGATTEVRFSLSSPLLLILAASGYIDNVSITATYPTTTTTTTTTTSTTAPTTTTTDPIITIPTVTLPTLPTSSTTTTSGGPATTTTAGPDDSTTSTTTTITTTTTAGGGPGGGPTDGGQPGRSDGGDDPGTVDPPLTAEEVAFANDNNIVVNLAAGLDFGGFGSGPGLNPLTDLWANLNTTVEAISTEILSAIALGAMITFFGVRRIRDEEPFEDSDG